RTFQQFAAARVADVTGNCAAVTGGIRGDEARNEDEEYQGEDRRDRTNAGHPRGAQTLGQVSHGEGSKSNEARKDTTVRPRQMRTVATCNHPVIFREKMFLERKL